MLSAAACGVAMRLRQTSKVKIALLSGGDPPKSGRGEAFALHGYFGVETQVVDTIARRPGGVPLDWHRAFAHSPPRIVR
jgi:hypothetical protein